MIAWAYRESGANAYCQGSKHAAIQHVSFATASSLVLTREDY